MSKTYRVGATITLWKIDTWVSNLSHRRVADIHLQLLCACSPVIEDPSKLPWPQTHATWALWLPHLEDTQSMHTCETIGSVIPSTPTSTLHLVNHRFRSTHKGVSRVVRGTLWMAGGPVRKRIHDWLRHYRCYTVGLGWPRRANNITVKRHTWVRRLAELHLNSVDPVTYISAFINGFPVNHLSEQRLYWIFYYLQTQLIPIELPQSSSDQSESHISWMDPSASRFSSKDPRESPISSMDHSESPFSSMDPSESPISWMDPSESPLRSMDHVVNHNSAQWIIVNHNSAQWIIVTWITPQINGS